MGGCSSTASTENDDRVVRSKREASTQRSVEYSRSHSPPPQSVYMQSMSSTSSRHNPRQGSHISGKPPHKALVPVESRSREVSHTVSRKSKKQQHGHLHAQSKLKSPGDSRDVSYSRSSNSKGTSMQGMHSISSRIEDNVLDMAIEIDNRALPDDLGTTSFKSSSEKVPASLPKANVSEEKKMIPEKENKKSPNSDVSRKDSSMGLDVVRKGKIDFQMTLARAPFSEEEKKLVEQKEGAAGLDIPNAQQQMKTNNVKPKEETVDVPSGTEKDDTVVIVVADTDAPSVQLQKSISGKGYNSTSTHTNSGTFESSGSGHGRGRSLESASSTLAVVGPNPVVALKVTTTRVPSISNSIGNASPEAGTPEKVRATGTEITPMVADLAPGAGWSLPTATHLEITEKARKGSDPLAVSLESKSSPTIRATESYEFNSLHAAHGSCTGVQESTPARGCYVARPPLSSGPGTRAPQMKFQDRIDDQDVVAVELLSFASVGGDSLTDSSGVPIPVSVLRGLLAAKEGTGSTRNGEQTSGRRTEVQMTDLPNFSIISVFSKGSSVTSCSNSQRQEGKDDSSESTKIRVVKRRPSQSKTGNDSDVVALPSQGGPGNELHTSGMTVDSCTDSVDNAASSFLSTAARNGEVTPGCNLGTVAVEKSKKDNPLPGSVGNDTDSEKEDIFVAVDTACPEQLHSMDLIASFRSVNELGGGEEDSDDDSDDGGSSVQVPNRPQALRHTPANRMTSISAHSDYTTDTAVFVSRSGSIFCDAGKKSQLSTSDEETVDIKVLAPHEAPSDKPASTHNENPRATAEVPGQTETQLWHPPVFDKEDDVPMEEVHPATVPSAHARPVPPHLIEKVNLGSGTRSNGLTVAQLSSTTAHPLMNFLNQQVVFCDSISTLDPHCPPECD